MRPCAVVGSMLASAASAAMGVVLAWGCSAPYSEASQGEVDGAPLRDAGATEGSTDGGDAGPAAGPACAPNQVECNGVCVVAVDCIACGGSPYFCGPLRRCLASCSVCVDVDRTAMPIECFACDTSQSDPVGSCARADSSGFCLNADYSKAFRGAAGEHCDCPVTKVSNCPGETQVCQPHGGTDWCITCGETGLNTSGLPCKNGKTCNTTVSPPRCM